MDKKPPPLLPPLSLDALTKVTAIEDYARTALLACINKQQARRIVGTSVVSMLDIQMTDYLLCPDFRQEWMTEIIEQTIESMIGLLPTFAPSEEFRPELRRIVQEHMERTLVRVQAERAKRAALKAASQPPTQTISEAAKPLSRSELVNSYLSNFPDEKIKILDICWAAGQHYREWKRWIKNQWRDGSTADLAFRKILTSGKRPLEFNKKPRPPKWQ